MDYREILRLSCLPLFWFRVDGADPKILHNATVTVVRSPERLFGITAGHVIEQYRSDCVGGALRVQLLDEVLEEVRVIDSSVKPDLATIELDEALVLKTGRQPLSLWPPRLPQEKCGILLAGYPGTERLLPQPLEVDWGLFTASAATRTVTEDQITILVPRDPSVENSVPPKASLGGISGGPALGLFTEPDDGLSYRLSGIITEHPDYSDSPFAIERIVATAADVITASGRLRYKRSEEG
jgi:hypothetical protein